MPNFWEENPGPKFYGHLKLGEAQQAGFDVHATFPRDGTLPHISVYEVSSTGGKVERNLYLRLSNGSVGLNFTDRKILIRWCGVTDEIADAFVRAAYSKHQQLNPVAPSVSSRGAPALSASDFPSLPSRSTPPLVVGRPVATTPSMNSPEAALLAQLPDNVRSVVLASGAFD